MIEYRPFYQFGYYLPHGISATPEIISKLMMEFKDLKLLPSTIPSFQIGPDQKVTNGLQLQLLTENRDLTVDFEPNRYLIKKLKTTEVPIPSIEDFARICKRIILVLGNLVPLNATRLSFVTTGLCKSMTPEELDKINSSLFNLPTKFKKIKPIEWNSRQIIRETRKIDGSEELMNIIIEIARVQGVLNINNGLAPFDRIEIGFDINTFQENNSQRFTPNSIAPFLTDSNAIQNELESSLKELLYA